tara:strand:+ start:170 stop:685 length:516 start_codon:yes stop_codon:yes gene_type:complete
MSNLAVQGGATGTGTVSLVAPSTSTDRTITLPDVTGTVQVSGAPISGTTASFSGDVTLGSSVLATPTGSAPAYLCRAWVNFNGTGTVAIRASGNVSSITDNGTGNYTINFTTAMSDVNFCAVGCAGDTNNAIGPRQLSTYPLTTGTCKAISGQTAVGTVYDAAEMHVAIFR